MTLKRTTDANVIEQRLLELAYTTDVKLTASVLAYFAPCSTDDADKVLDRLAALGRLQMEVEDNGTVVYHLPNREKLASPPQPQPLPRALVRQAGRSLPREASPTLAALFSVFLPGAGHIYTGRMVSAILWFLVVSAGYALILPGLILHLFNITSAAASAHRLNANTARLLAA